ncbi:hypothetical protein GGI07_004985 [Coemansia sp. Benny D115]|nr:hypothetical protein GGI07_004985 [Coemansia sp. Benny D115]
MSSTSVAANSTLDLSKESQTLIRASAVNMSVFLDHVRKYQGAERAKTEFSGAAFKSSIDSLATAIDKEVTRFLIACKPPALDREIKELSPKINAGAFQLVQLLNTVPKTAGSNYLDSVRRAIARTILSLIMLFNSFIDDKVNVEEAVVAELTFLNVSGIFWENCKALGQIPKDNRAAVLSLWTDSVSGLVKDAAEELSESLDEAKDAADGGKEGDEDDNEDDDDDMDDFNPEIPADRVEQGRKMQKLVLIAKHTCDKVGLRCIRDCAQLDDERTVWLDRLLDFGKPVQAAVDELISTLFIEGDDWAKQMEIERAVLTEALEKLVTLAITFVDDSHLPWFEMCRKQLEATKNVTSVVR